MPVLDIPADIERSDINIDLNSVIFSIFLMGMGALPLYPVLFKTEYYLEGMYTVIYFGTLYLYCTKNSSKQRLVPVTITVLYLSCIIGTAVQWYGTKSAFVDNGDTRQAVFMAIFDNPPWVYVALNISNCIAFVVADGLLIWRCFYVWDRSLRIISVPLFLIVTESALFLVQISFHAKFNDLSVSQALVVRIDDVLSAAFFLSFATTLITTILIAYRISAFSNQQGISSRRFMHIMDIVIQSGVVYALSQFTAAVAGVVPGAGTSNTRNVAFIDFAELLNIAIAGISPTVMVARVALLSADATYPSTSVHLSGLQFQARSTHPTVNTETIEITHSVDSPRISIAGEGQVDKDKAQYNMA